MFKNLKKRTDGFTIIEVLIVLAIAGLILLIVFLAVPALQRNSRNTQRRNDISKVLGVLAEAANNNNGTLFNAPSGSTTTLPDVLNNEAFSQYDTANFDYRIVAGSTAQTLPGNISAAQGLNQVFIRNGYKCVTAVPLPQGTFPINMAVDTNATPIAGEVVTNSGATTRSLVALFTVEQQGGRAQIQCVES